MIEILAGFSENVIAMRASGHITRQDYDTVLIPRVEAAARTHPKLRLYYEIGAEYTGIAPGAMWEDAKVGIEYWSRWERMAVVTDIAWIAHTLHAFGFVMPGALRVFPTAERDAARAWIKAD